MDDERLTSEERARQINYYMLMRSYQEAFGWNASLDKGNITEGSRKEIENELLAIAESGFRIAISFSPVGKFVDFCELVTGRSLCTLKGEQLSATDRALAGLGIFVGSGVALRKIAKSQIIREAVLVQDLMIGFERIITAGKSKFAGSDKQSHRAAVKFLEILSPTVSKKNASEIIARSEHAMTEHLKYLGKIDLINPRLENMYWKILKMLAPHGAKNFGSSKVP